MATILTPHEPRTELYSEPNHPVVRVVWDGEMYLSAEGTHRANAAQRFGYPLNIDVINVDDVVEHDIPDLPCPCAALDIIDYLHSGEPTFVDVEIIE